MRAVADGGAAASAGATSSTVAQSAARPVRWGAVLVGLAVAAAGVRLWLAGKVPTPWIFIDEVLHAELAESVAAGEGFRARGERVTVSFVYPLLLAPAWWADEVATSYAVAKIVNVIAMASSVVPLYLWGRGLVRAPLAVFACALTLLLPAFALTATLSTENAAFPAFVLAFWAFARVVERPSLGRQTLALAAVALAAAARVQGVVLLAVLPLAVVLDALFAPRAREVWPALRRLAPFAAAVAVVAVVAALLEARDEGRFSLGVYTESVEAEYSAALVKWLVYSVGDLAVMVAILPLAALALLVGRRRELDPAARAFVAVASAAVVALVALATVSSEWRPEGIKERYMIYAAPLLFLALALWLDRGMPRTRRSAVVVGGVVAALVVVLPLRELFEAPSFQSNAFGLFVLYRAAVHLGGVGVVEALVAAGAVAAALAIVLARGRFAWLLAAAVAAYLAVASVAAFTSVRSISRDVSALTRAGGDRSWIDARASRVLFLNTTAFQVETPLGGAWRTWNAFWTTEFWNRSVAGTLDLGLAEPAPLAQRRGTVDWATGEIRGAGAVRHVLSDRRFAVRGRRVARRGRFVLTESARPLAFAAVAEGVFLDGRMGERAAYDRWSPRVRGSAVVSVSRRGIPGDARVRVEVGTLKGGGAPQFDVITERRSARLRGGATRTFTVPAPRPPFRVEVFVEGGGARVAFAFRRRSAG